MQACRLRGIVTIVALAALVASTAAAQDRRAVTVQELFNRNHRIEVATGTTIVWADPHFDRVWFPPDGPAVKGTSDGRVSVFDAPGDYHGRFTVAGPAHAAADVYTVTIVVRPRS
jgi:hypothetical protein